MLRNLVKADFGGSLGPASIFVVKRAFLGPLFAKGKKVKIQISDPFLQFWLNQALLRGVENGGFCTPQRKNDGFLTFRNEGLSPHGQTGGITMS